MAALTTYLRNILSLAILIVTLTACATTPEPLEVSEEMVIEATVTAIDLERRLVTLRGPEGNSLNIHVQPEVRNLAQVSAGDKLKVSYTRALIASMTEPGQASSEVPVVAAAARAPEGTMPGVAAGAVISATVEVISAGADGSTLTFRGPAGELRSIDVVQEVSRAFVRKLKPGDEVDMTYSEAVAVEVEHLQ